MMIDEGIIAVTNRKICETNGVNFFSQIDCLAGLGIKNIILREKDLSIDDYAILAKRVKEICDKNRQTLILHYHYDTNNSAIRSLGIKKIHLPLKRLEEMSKDRENLEYYEVIGASIHSLEELKTAEKLNASYVVCGNIYETKCKEGLSGKGLEFLREISGKAKIPVYAIGGVTFERMREIKNTGAAGACMMSNLMTITPQPR